MSQSQSGARFKHLREFTFEKFYERSEQIPTYYKCDMTQTSFFIFYGEKYAAQCMLLVGYNPQVHLVRSEERVQVSVRFGSYCSFSFRILRL